MAARGPFVLVLAGVLASMGASYHSTNFVVEAPTPQLAQQAGQYAEHYRQQKALDWLGQEMAPWPEPCPLKVTVTGGGAGGATSFAFDRGRVLGQNMHVEGSVERLMNSVLPHEVTHTVFAHYFKTPVPRWADEGGAVLSEDDVERNRHDMLCRQILNTPGRAIPLRRLFALKEYPGDVMALYAQGFSVTNFLVASSNRQQFLGFVATGMREGWDRAAQSYYRYQSVEELEQAWLNNLRSTKRPPAELARNTRPADGDSAAAKLVVRQTVPPAQPFDEPRQPTFRGRAPEEERAFESGGWSGRPARLPATDPGKQTASSPPPPDPPPGVRLMAPEYGPPAVQMGQPLPGPVSPVGYPR